MKKKFVIALLGVFVNVLALAQQGPPQQLPSVSAANQRSLSSSLGLHSFPAKDQTPQQQQSDEAACYHDVGLSTAIMVDEQKAKA